MNTEASKSVIALNFALNFSKSQNQNFDIEINEQLPSTGITGVFGPSGSGKTSLLRSIAGLEPEAKGSIRFLNSEWLNKQSSLPPHKRPIAYVFQEASLFPHLNVEGNLRFAQKRAWPGEPLLNFDDAVHFFGLKDLVKRQVEDLSGGERQRVALARALLINPSLILMDEPLSALDERSKSLLLPYIEKLHNKIRVPIVYVSHSLHEISRLADYLIIIENGKVVRSGELKTMLAALDAPTNKGSEAGIVTKAKILDHHPNWHMSRLKFGDSDLWIRQHSGEANENILIRILANDVSLSLNEHSDTSVSNILPASIEQIVSETHSGTILVRLSVGDESLIARITARSFEKLALKTGMKVWAQVKSVALIG